MLSILLFIREVARAVYYHFSHNERIEKVWRLPVAKALNANFLGLTLGLFTVIVISTFLFRGVFPSDSNILAARPWYEITSLLLLFVVGTYLLRAFFVVVIGLALSAFFIFDPAGALALSFKTLSGWYLGGYGFGALLAILYDDLVFLYLRFFERDEMGFAFAYYPDRPFNIIKSPDVSHEAAYEALLRNDPELVEQRVYNFDLTSQPEQPYTILFIANPFVQSDDPDHPFKPDPMIDHRELFYNSVDWALRSLESNEIIGKRSIWGKVRVATIFDKTMKKASPESVALVQEFGNMVIDGETPLNLIAPREKLNDLVAAWLHSNETNSDLRIAVEQSGAARSTVDVVFALSAHPTHDRSTALFSDVGEEGLAVGTMATGGNEFEFVPDPGDKKGDDIRLPEILRNGDKPHHERFSARPGRVALNVLGAIPRTFVHEFAHAMSSAINGMVTDEYADKFDIGIEPPEVPPFYINKIVRKRPEVRVHKIFSDYEEARFTSELDHPSERENWYGYFPDVEDSTVSCIMDRFTSRHRFDALLANFIYDRLHAKVNR